MNPRAITLFVKLDPKIAVSDDVLYWVMVDIENAAEEIPGVLSAQAYKEPE